jgi:signal transduction histidine kinase/ActR/RegA family two-component response regulator
MEVARQAESERRRLDALLEAAPVGIVVTDASGSVIRVNAENRRLWGNHPMSTTVDDYTGWKGWWADRSERHGLPLQPHEWSMTRALSGEDAPRQIIEIESFDPPHTRRIVLNSGAPIRDGSGQIVGGVVAQMDITDRIGAEEALREADRKKDEFLAMLAHELRNPLAPITSAAEILSMGRFDEARVRQTSAIISRQAKHMTGLLEELLDVSRVTQGKINLDKMVLDVKDVIADAIEQVRPLVEKHKHRLTVQLAPVPTFTFGDHKRLVQVMTNLLSNAAKYTPDGGRIEVRLEAEADKLMIAVNDNGLGMDADLLEGAFDLFAQGQRNLDRSQGGLGIGLALVRSLLHLHDGTIAAYSHGPGTGSTFTVRLPHAVAEIDLTQGQQLRKKESYGALRIVVVDDNEDAALAMAMLLETFSHVVTVMHSPGEALEKLPSIKPDICLLDIGLPEMDGFALARRLRQIPETAGAVLVAVTGYGQERDRQAAAVSGFDEFLVKPVDQEMLNDILSRTANLSQRLPTNIP